MDRHRYEIIKVRQRVKQLESIPGIRVTDVFWRTDPQAAVYNSVFDRLFKTDCPVSVKTALPGSMEEAVKLIYGHRKILPCRYRWVIPMEAYISLEITDIKGVSGYMGDPLEFNAADIENGFAFDTECDEYNNYCVCIIDMPVNEGEKHEQNYLPE